MAVSPNNSNSSNKNKNTSNNDKFSFIDAELHKLYHDNLYRKLRYGISVGSQIKINDKTLINLCSNDYLGISVPFLSSSYANDKTLFRQIQSSSRLVSGNDESFKKLERTLAKHKSHEGSLIYPTGYMANIGVISTVIDKKDTVFSDELNHASIIESCKLTGARIVIYKHNDTDDLNKKLKKQCTGKKFVITEGIFSMDGDIAPLDGITELAQKEDAITIVDDAHGDFVIGRDGRGTPDHLRVAKSIDIYTSSLSKGLGSFGGYIASQNNVVDYCINKSKSFIYTSALPSVLVEYAQKKIMSASRERQRKRLEKNTQKIIHRLREIGYEIHSNTHIIPIVVKDEKKALGFSEFLLKNGVFVQPIRYPTVPQNQARLRISVTAWLNDTDIEKVLDIFQRGYKKFYNY